MTNIFKVNQDIHRTSIKLSHFIFQSLVKNHVFFSSSQLPSVIISDFAKDNDPRLGYFDPIQNLIVINIVFMDPSLKDELYSICLHELAHWLVYMEKGTSVPDHGAEFIEACKRLQVPEDFSRATTALKNWAERREKASRKIQKLIALTSSPFEAESESALLKAKELSEQYCLQSLLNVSDELELYGVGDLPRKRMDAWRNYLGVVVADLAGCYRICEWTAKGYRMTYYGTREQVETALYFHTYFEDALEKEYKANKKHLYGISEKNSFLLGACKTLWKKLFINGKSKSLVLSQARNERIYSDITHARVERSSYQSSSVSSSFFMGLGAGQNINIPERQSACSIKRIEG